MTNSTQEYSESLRGQRLECSVLLAERNKKASEIVKLEVERRELESGSPLYKSWRYTDFVDEGRFLYEVKTDKGVNDSMDAEELAEYAIEQIYS